MEGLNYHHLLYFRVVAREGSIARASEKLKVSQPTISEQVRTLEEQTGTPLFTRQGRRLVLTEAGRTALRYAEDIHTLGDELIGALRGQPVPKQQRLNLGVADGLPSRLAAQLAGAFTGRGIRPNIQSGETRALLEEVSTGALDMMLSDSAPPASPEVVGHKIASLPVIIAGLPSVARKQRRSFPGCVASVPMLLPPSGTRLGSLVENWFAAKRFGLKVAAESADFSVIESMALGNVALLAVAGEPPRGLSEVGRLDRVKLDVFLVANSRASAHMKTALHALRGRSH